MENSPCAETGVDDVVVGSGLPGQQQATQRIRGGRTNSSILGHEAGRFPPVLKDFFDEAEGNMSTFVRAFWTLSDRIPGLPNAFWSGQALSRVRYSRQLYSGLPHAVDGSKHVFVVTKPHVGWPVSGMHWSLYCQGYFYHLSIDGQKKPARQTYVSGLNASIKGPRTLLKKEDLSTTSTKEYTDAESKAAKKPLIAFEVGQTQYSPEDIEKLARSIIEELREYNLLEANCQIFTQSLLYRVVMTQRDYSTFVGNKTQLVDWDLRGRLDTDALSPNTIALGFLIKNARRPNASSVMSAYPLYYLTALDATEARSIRVLYEKGHLHPGAKDPTGEDGALGYVWHGTKKDLRECLEGLRRALREFRDDIAARRSRDAFYGREAFRMERLEQLQEEKTNGRRFTGIETAILKTFSRST
ncbi:hypothetical protein SLS56_011654 [Neofusicoccum ribis]|uniref:FluG domain-containing protein n=1 Tax=Neofusicoccum ribis TaxID=45134 RepID=A0ABR3SB20_9PEZI